MDREAQKDSRIISLNELREEMPKYISEVDKGKTFTVVKRSKPVFQIGPPTDDGKWETVADFTQVQQGGVDIDELLERL